MGIRMGLIHDGIFSDFGNKKTEGLPEKAPEKPSDWEH